MKEKVFTIHKKESYIHIIFHQKANKTQVMQMLDEAFHLDTTGFRYYNCESGLDTSVDEMREIAEYGRKHFAKSVRLAFYTKDLCTYGLLRAFEVFREEAVTQTRVFKSEEEALQWLFDGMVLPS